MIGLDTSVLDRKVDTAAPMSNSLEVESTLTDRYRTTVPETVRRALKLSKRDRIHYIIRPDGEVVLSRAATANEADPVLTESSGLP